MRKESLILWVVVILMVGGTVFALAKLPKKTVVPGPSDQPLIAIPAVSAVDWLAGNKESAVTLVEYGDFQCPACAAYHPLVNKLLKEQGENFRFVYRHFPLRQHLQAKDAAYAAEAAGRQGKFWEMYDLIFQNQIDWAEKSKAKDIFLGYAVSLELDAEQFKKDRDLSEVKTRVEKDAQDGLKIGVNSTPTFYLNAKKIQPRNYDEFVNLLKQAGGASQ